jgi:hypothetical protein
MTFGRLALLSMGLLITVSGLAAETRRYVILSPDGKRMGEHISEQLDDGSIRARYVLKDNGRGPELEESCRLALDGTLADYHVKGTSIFGAAVDEQFTLKDGLAQWRSTTEEGRQGKATGAIYIPLNQGLEATQSLLLAMAKRQDNRLPLLPSGTLTQKRIDEANITSASGAQLRVQLLALSGLGFTPSFSWTTVEASPRIIAQIVPGYTLTVEEGWESAGRDLERRQVIAEKNLLQDMAKRLMHPMPGLTVLRNARVYDSVKGELGSISDVYILRGRISAVLPAGTPMQGKAAVIDAGGRVLLPGLFDMHGHVTPWDGGLNLAAGVTTSRDMGNDNATLQRLMDNIADGHLLSPQIVPCGFLEGDSPFHSQADFLVKTLDQAKQAVDWYAQRGYPQLKIYNSFPKEHLKDTVAYAHTRGMRVSGHVPVFMRAQDAVDAGFDEIQHINQVLLNFLVTPATDTRTLDRFYLVAERVGSLDLDSKQVQQFITFLRDRKVVVDPTLTTFDFFRQREGELSKAYARVADHLPPDIQRGFRMGTMRIPDEATAKRYEASYSAMIAFVGRLYRQGVPLVAGTDALAGFTLWRELELYVQAGLTPAQAIQVATLNGAIYSRTFEDRGVIASGRRADLVLVDGDPTKDITDLQKILLVITQGKLMYPHEIHEELGIKPFVTSSPAIRE